MKKTIRPTLIATIILLGNLSSSFAVEVAPRISDREIIEGLATIRADIKVLNQRIDGLEIRIIGLDKRIDNLQNLMYVIIAGIFGLIGFVVWDRRTAVKPAMDKIEKLERDDENLKKVLREYAKQEPRFAEILKNIGIL